MRSANETITTCRFWWHSVLFARGYYCFDCYQLWWNKDCHIYTSPQTPTLQYSIRMLTSFAQRNRCVTCTCFLGTSGCVVCMQLITWPPGIVPHALLNGCLSTRLSLQLCSLNCFGKKLQFYSFQCLYVLDSAVLQIGGRICLIINVVNNDYSNTTDNNDKIRDKGRACTLNYNSDG